METSYYYVFSELKRRINGEHSPPTNNPIKSAFIARSRFLFTLEDNERWWRDHAAQIKYRGYRLRKRFRPGWRPSWHGTNIDPHFVDDAIQHKIDKVIDIRRIDENGNEIGEFLAVKKVPRGSEEISILKLLTAKELLGNPVNHCVPVIDHFQDTKDTTIDYIVMPLLRKFDDPEFYSINEVIDFVRQVLEGLAFMHSKGIAHRNCTEANIMMDGSTIYPSGFHPTEQDRLPNLKGEAVSLRRSDVKGVRYLFIDFSLSVRFGDEDKYRQAVGKVGEGILAPELSDDTPYDPFPVDIFAVGNVIRKSFLERFSNLNFLRPMMELMMQDDPHCRPTAHDTLDQLNSLLLERKRTQDWRLIQNDEHSFAKVLRDAQYMIRKVSM